LDQHNLLHPLQQPLFPGYSPSIFLQSLRKQHHIFDLRNDPLDQPPQSSSKTRDTMSTYPDRVVQAPGPLTEDKNYNHDIEHSPSPPHSKGSKPGSGYSKEAYGGDLEPSTTVHEGEQKYNRLGWMKLTTLLIVEAIALGSLSVPSAFASVGMVAGVILCVGLGLIAIYTSYVIGQVKLKYPHIEHYADAVKLIWGRFGYELTGAMFALFLILLVGSHTLTGTIAFIRIVDDPTMCALVWAAISAVILFALAVPPSFSEFAILGYIDFVSIVIAIGITIIATGIVAGNQVGGMSAVPWSAWPPADMTLKSAFLSTTNIVFAYSFAVCQFSFMSEMHTPTDYVKSIWALGLIEIFIYTLTGALVYAFVGVDVASPALLSAGPKVSRIAFGIALPVIFISGSINSVVVGRYIMGRAFPNSPIKYINTKAGWAVWLTLILAITVIAWVIAEAIPFFNALLGIISALFISGFTFYFPALFWFQLIKEGKWNANKKNIALSIFNAIIFVVGVAILGLGTYASAADIADQYKVGSSSKPRSPFTCDSSSYA
jgi:amino acid permease